LRDVIYVEWLINDVIKLSQIQGRGPRGFENYCLICSQKINGKIRTSHAIVVRKWDLLQVEVRWKESVTLVFSHFTGFLFKYYFPFFFCFLEKEVVILRATHGSYHELSLCLLINFSLICEIYSFLLKKFVRRDRLFLNVEVFHNIILIIF